jgi:hypothetical protein
MELCFQVLAHLFRPCLACGPSPAYGLRQLLEVETGLRGVAKASPREGVPRALGGLHLFQHGDPPPRQAQAPSRRGARPALGWPDRLQSFSGVPGGGSHEHVAPAVRRVAARRPRGHTASQWGYDACDIDERPVPSTTGEPASLQHMRAPYEARPRPSCGVLPHAPACAAPAPLWLYAGAWGLEGGAAQSAIPARGWFVLYERGRNAFR